MLPWTASCAVALECLTRKVGRCWRDGGIGNGKLPQKAGQAGFINGGRHQLCKGDGADDQRPLRRGLEYGIQPLLVPGLFFDDGPEDR